MADTRIVVLIMARLYPVAAKRCAGGRRRWQPFLPGLGATGRGWWPTDLLVFTKQGNSYWMVHATCWRKKERHWRTYSSNTSDFFCVTFYGLSSVLGFSTKSLELPSCRAWSSSCRRYPGVAIAQRVVRSFRHAAQPFAAKNLVW